MNEWVWSIGGMILTGDKRSTGRKTLYSVCGRWMNEYGALVEWYWQGVGRKSCHCFYQKTHTKWPGVFFFVFYFLSVFMPLFLCKTSIHAFGGIRTRNPSKRPPADSCPIPLGHCDQRDRTLASAVSGRRLKAWVTSWLSFVSCFLYVTWFRLSEAILRGFYLSFSVTAWMPV
jgi:hypothetical protein